MISPGSNISEKDFAHTSTPSLGIRLEILEDKVSRFTMKEIKSGFRKSQLVDTQIISKICHALFENFFNVVDVQKGSIPQSSEKYLEYKK